MFDNAIVFRFKEIVKDHYNDTAVVYYNKKVTYGELDDISDRIADYIKINASGGKVIGIYMDKNIDSVAAMIGIMKAGYTYMPISKSFPADRISRMMEISDTCAVISDGSNDIEKLMNGRQHIRYEDAAECCEKSESTSDNSQHAYILFTSGSTGDPKGIMIKNDSVVNIAECMNDCISPRFNRIGCTAPICFDMSVAQIYYPLLFGKTLVIVPDEIRNIPDRFLNYLDEHKVEVIDMTPTLMTMVMKYADSVREGVNFPTELISGGEPLPQEVAAMLFRKLLKKEDSRVFNFYGPTEACVYATVYTIDKSLANSMEYMKIGSPLRNYDIIIRNKDNSESDDGEIGEICITGKGLSTGYCGNKELTDKVFIPSVRNSSETMYCTGDLGFKDKNGEYVCLGRSDDQVKIRGYRIELGEVENALLQCENIRQAKVIKHTVRGIDQLVGFYSGDNEIDEKVVAARLADLLPDYMIPSRLIRIEKIELTINGKADRKKLISLLNDEKKTAEYNKDETDRFVMDVCTELLEYNKNELSAEDDFFLSGGDSVRLMELYSRIYDTFGVSVSISVLYSKSRFSEIADEIRRCLSESKDDAVEYSEQSDITWLQRTIIRNEKIETKKKFDKYGMYFPSYNIMHIIEFHKPVDKNRFRDSAMKVINRHGAFHTVFISEKNKYIMTRTDAELRAEDIFSYVDSEMELTDENMRKYAKNFDIEKAPLIQIVFFSNEGGSKVLFNVHHCIFDYFSMKIFMNELADEYNNTGILHENTDFISQLNAQNTRDKSEYAEFWKKYISGRSEKAEFAASYKKARDTRNSSFTVYNRVIGGETIYALRELGKNIGVTEYNMMMSLFAMILHKYSELDDLFLGTYLPGRESKSNNTIGLFTKLIPIRFSIDEGMTTAELFTDTNDNLKKILSNYYIDHDEIYVAMNFEDYVQGELFSVIFNYVNDINENNGELVFSSHECGDEPEKMPFSIKIFSGDDKIRISIVASDSNYSQESISEIMDDYIRLINVTAFSSSDTEIKLLEQEINNYYEKSNNRV